MKQMALIVLMFVLSPLVADTLPDEPHVVVSGSHTVKTVPDIVKLSLSLIHVHRDVAVATEDVDSRSSALIEALDKLGVARKDINSSSLQVVPRYNWNNREQVYQGTEVSRRIEITLRDLDKYDHLMQAVIGAKVGRIDSTILESTKKERLIARALRGAVEDARKKAELLVSGMDTKVGRVFSIASTSVQPVFRGAQAETFRAAATQTSAFEPGQIQFTQSVTVVFYLVHE